MVDFMCLTMIHPATSWFEIVELPTVPKLTAATTGKGKSKKVTFADYIKVAEMTFDKSSAQISNLVYKTWFGRYLHCRYLIYNNGSKFKLHFHAHVIHMAQSLSQPVSRTFKQMLYWSIVMQSLRTCYTQLNLIWPSW